MFNCFSDLNSPSTVINSVMCLQGHHFDILHRNGEEHFDADAVSRILHSGDIQEAQEAVDIERDDDKLVTMKDIHLLNRLLQLQLLSSANARGDNMAYMPMNPDAIGGPDKQAALVKKFNKKFSRTVDDISEIPLILETNMVLINGEGPEGSKSQKEPGLIEAQNKARQAKDRLRHTHLEQSTVAGTYTSSSSSSTSHKDSKTASEDNDDENEDDEIVSDSHDSDNGVDIEQDSDDNNNKERRIMIPSGPFRWTTTVIKEFMTEYRHLEGKLLLHPRTGRLYEVGTVFFYDKLKIAAAYIRSVDGGQADPLDEHPHRIDGKGGLAELVDKFSTSGGSSGSSKTPWPTSECEWLDEQKKDPQWCEVIEEMEREYLSQRINI